MKKNVLYLATFDPTVSASGTSTRGKLFLRFFCEHYNVHLVHMKEVDCNGKDEKLIKELSNKKTIEYSKWSYFIFSKKFYIAAKSVLMKNRIDFIFADFEKSGWYAYLLNKIFKIPYVYSSHNVEYLRYIDFAIRNKLRYLFVPYMYFVEKKAVKNALFTIAISEKDATSFRPWSSENNILVMPCTFDEEVFNPFYDEIITKDPIILMVGNYRNPGNREGAYLMYEKVIPGVVKSYPNAIFRCIGKNFPEDIIAPNIEAVGFVDDLVKEYQKATVVIVPITVGGGIKIKAIEGLACGKYLISTTKGMEGIDAVGFENVQILPIDKFSDCIVEAISDKVGKTTNNFEKLKIGYGTRHQLYKLKEKIELGLK